MKFNIRRFLMAALPCAIPLILCLSAFAQNGFDFFALPRVEVVTGNQKLITATTNTSVAKLADVHGFEGVARLDIFSCTNGLSGACTAVLLTSPDAQNWSLVPYGMLVPTSLWLTNLYYGTNGFVVTNSWLLPGTVTTPTAATAGWATPYLGSVPSLTNLAAIALTNGEVSVGINSGALQRYLTIGYTMDANSTNIAVGAIITGRVNNVP